MRARLLKKRIAGKLAPVNLGEVAHSIWEGQFDQSEGWLRAGCGACWISAFSKNFATLSDRRPR